MDVCKIEPLTKDHRRWLLVPHEKNNAVPATGKPPTRDAASRYKSGISSAPASAPGKPRRSPSPVTGHTPQVQETSLPKRPQSAERRRPSTPPTERRRSSTPPTERRRPSTPPTERRRPSTPPLTSSRPSTPSSPSSRLATPVHDKVIQTRDSSTRRSLSSRAPDGLWPSVRSLSSSFQLESIPISVSKKDKVVASSSDQSMKTPANKEPERKKTPLRGRNTTDQSENSRPLETSNARAITQHRWPGILGGRVSANGLLRSVDLTDKFNRSASLSVPSRGTSPKRTPMSYGAASNLQQPMSKVSRQTNIDGSEKVERDIKSGVHQPSGRSSSLTQPSRTQSLPFPGSQRPSSPSRVLSTPSSTSRGIPSQSWTRPSTPVSSSGSTIIRSGGTSSALNYIVDVRKARKDPNHIEDGHQLRLIYNAVLQWCFVNAQVDEKLSIEKMRTEEILYGKWHTVSELRDSVIRKRIGVQHLRQETKLGTVLNEQIVYLKHWIALEREYSSSLSGAVEVLKTSTLQLPVAGGARADALSLKNAVSSAVDVMQGMGSSICYLLFKVDSMLSLVSELSVVAAKERSLLDECRELLASTATMQVQESSLRSHLIQVRQDAL